MTTHLIYGKIIIDDLSLAGGGVVRNVLGGGGPQAAFGARLWHDEIGFLTRTGTDLEPAHVETIQNLRVDLAGWHRYPDIPTPYNRLYVYDEHEYLQPGDGELLSMAIDQEAWGRLLAQSLDLPTTYQAPKSIHLITEFFDEPMIETALGLKQKGAVLSLEPILDYVNWKNLDGLLPLLKEVDIVSPDWPSASGIAKREEPKAVLAHWSSLGPRCVAIRHGQHGSYVWSAVEDRMWHVPVLPVQVVDPTGAGNSYSGGFCVGWTDRHDARIAGCYGTIAARYLVERVGLPEWSEQRGVEAMGLVDQLLERVVAL